MPFYIAIDAGGTNTRALLADERHILARASTGSVKLQRVGETEATARLASMLREVSAAANIPLTEIVRTCIGLAGLTIPAVRTWATRALSAQIAGELLLLGDEEIALEAAFPGAPGVLLIAGTGSHSIARTHDGTLHRAGGHGPVLGDEGGGYWIGLEALRSALRALDSHPDESPSALLQAIQLHWNLTSLSDLIELGNRRGEATRSSPDFASLAPVVARSAAEGNSIATDVLNRAGQLLAQLIVTAANKASPTTSPSRAADATISVAYTGSVLERIPAVRAALTATLNRTLTAAKLTHAPVDPLEGALFRARHVWIS